MSLTQSVESEEWFRTFHSSEIGAEQRRREAPKKLRKLGIDRASRDVAVAELCCGGGEHLEALYDLGFRNLAGLDMFISPRLLEDKRFTVLRRDACDTQLPDSSEDWVLILHALHHMEDASKVQRLVDEAYRVLKPGGRLAVIDFPNSLQVRLIFWLFRRHLLFFTPYLRHFGELVRQEWPFLKDYLPKFPSVWKALHDPRFTVEVEKQEFFLFYLTMRKRGETGRT
jgi:ubiquinone/menaquinone biosynthesis C-methylase UbiE